MRIGATFIPITIIEQVYCSINPLYLYGVSKFLRQLDKTFALLDNNQPSSIKSKWRSTIKGNLKLNRNFKHMPQNWNSDWTPMLFFLSSRWRDLWTFNGVLNRAAVEHRTCYNYYIVKHCRWTAIHASVHWGNFSAKSNLQIIKHTRWKSFDSLLVYSCINSGICVRLNSDSSYMVNFDAKLAKTRCRMWIKLSLVTCRTIWWLSRTTARAWDWDLFSQSVVQSIVV